MNILDLYCHQKGRKMLKQLLDVASQNHPDGLPDFFLEKDLWVTEILRILYQEKLLGDYSVAFKGGTALSKCWKIIDRFSEDIDLSIHWADLAKADDEAAEWEKSTSSGSQAKKFRDNQAKRLTEWSTLLVDRLNERFADYRIDGLIASLDDDSKGEKVEIHFPRVTDNGHSYHLDHVLLEFGGRNRGHPTHDHQITCYMAQVPMLQPLRFPEAIVQAYDPGYIMWEKLTALHQFSTMTRELPVHRLARHWYDVDCMLAKDFVNPLANTKARDDVIMMKKNRWPESGVDYEQGLRGELQLIPGRDRLANIADDHQASIDGRMFYTSREPDSFEQIIDRIRIAQKKINEANSLKRHIEDQIQWLETGAWKQAVIVYKGHTYRSKMLLIDDPGRGIKFHPEEGINQLLNNIIGLEFFP